MANRSGLLALARGVRAYFAGTNVSANVAVGWTARSRIDNQGEGGANRVVFIPGVLDPNTGAPKAMKAGTFDRNGAQNHIAQSPARRALAWWHEPITVSVWAVDPERPQDEEAQIEATEALLEQTVRAIHNAVDPETKAPVGFANVEQWGDPVWTVPPGENSFGRELTFPIVLLVPLFDQEQDLVKPQAAVARNPPT